MKNILLLLLSSPAFLTAQGAQGPAVGKVDEIVTEARVLEAVTWLAHDDRRGRDTPSPGLEAAAQWLARRFEAAGLQQVSTGTWFHAYTLRGLQVDSRTIALKLERKLHQDEPEEFGFEPDVDVRLWRAGDVGSGDREPATVAQAADPVLRQMLRAQTGRRPIVIEVGEDHPYWQMAAGARSMLAVRRAAARPVFLLRAGLLPPLPGGANEAGWAATWNVPVPKLEDLPLKNVVGLLPGGARREEYVVVSAHYDHVGQGDPIAGDSIYNGADDDATGTTAVVLIAEALARMPAPRRSVLFVAFSAEEKGLRGSRAFVEHPPVPREQIVANINIEMIGRPGVDQQNKAWITGHALSDLAEIAGIALPRAGVEVVDFPMARTLFAMSDNYSFVRQGIVAHSISAGSIHRDYHRPSDEVGKLDIPHMTQVIRGLAELVHEVANRETAPQWNAAGKKLVERIRR